MSKSNLAVVNSEPACLGEWSASQLSIIKSQIAVGCSDGELELFAQVCARTGLDPFTRQIYAISRNSWNPATKQSEPKMTIQLSIDGFRAMAASSGNYGGSQTFWCGEDGIWADVWLSNTPPSAAKTEVYRTNCDRPFVGIARFNSYAQRKKDGGLSGQWPAMPDVMIGKCSEALALRKAFPAQLSGLYSTEEMGQASNSEVQESSISPSDLWKKAESLGWRKDNMIQLLSAYGFNGPDGVGSFGAIPRDRLGFVSLLIEDPALLKEFATGAGRPLDSPEGAALDVTAEGIAS
jgi:phage recombination protein Bet